MKNHDIKELMLNQRDDSPFLEELRRRFFPHKKVLLPAERLVYPMRDPAFEFHFAAAYARAGRVLPNEVFYASVWRAWSHLRYGEEVKHTDPVGCEAMALAHPSNRTMHALIKGLLCSGLSYTEVAKWAGRSVAVIELYASWFFDFIPRQGDRTFIASVLNPRTELSLVRNDKSQNPVLLAIQLGYQQGPAAVVRLLKLTDERNADSDSDISASLKRTLLRDANMKAKAGLLDADDPGLAIFKTLAAAAAKNQPEQDSEDMRMGFGRISADKACQLVIRQMTQESALEKLKYAQEYDSREAAAADARRKAAEAVAGDGKNAAQNAT